MSASTAARAFGDGTKAATPALPRRADRYRYQPDGKTKELRMARTVATGSDKNARHAIIR
ncbi:hypothetical protein GCM10010109_58140 [Actinoplanes campanulatus]|nr:hypothetical protein GCM10010109_58140 [Actinoplanes campanulatus]GID38800.1 hypothetical protein Aca09nite_53060 [Actinoplanes campanulatus]